MVTKAREYRTSALIISTRTKFGFHLNIHEPSSLRPGLVIVTDDNGVYLR